MQRAVVVLYYFEDRPTPEIVEILEMSQSTVRVHLTRARRRLADLLREEVDNDVD
jgi:RNA polymerase sigma-70 factor (ECF subfamily)